MTGAKIDPGSITPDHLAPSVIPARVVAEVAGGTSPVLVQGKNVQAVSHTGTGQYRVTLNPDGTFISSDIVWIASTRATTGSASVLVSTEFANQITVYTHNSGGLANYNFFLVGY